MIQSFSRITGSSWLKLRWFFAILCLAQIVVSGCDRHSATDVPASPSQNPAAASDALIPQYTYEVVHTWPHDRGAFTQGLFYLDGFLYESTGLNGESSLRKVELATG